MRNKIIITAKIFTAVFIAVSLSFGAAGDGGYPSPHLMSDAILNFSDWTSFVSNPALMTEVDQKEVSLGGLRLLEDAGYSYLSYAHPIRLNHTAAISVFSSSLSEIQTYDPYGRLGNNIDFGEWEIVLSYAWRVLPFLSVGANATTIGRNITQQNFGMGVDAGVVFNPVNNYRYGNLNIGLCMQNLFNTSLKEGISKSSTNYPTNLRTGISYWMLRNRLVFDSEILMLDLLAKTADFGGASVSHPIKIGGHAKYFLMRGFALKAGLNNNQLPFAGVILLGKRINIFRAIRFDYDFWYDTKGVGVSNMLKVAARIGGTREEIESGYLYKKLIIAPMNDFNEAMRLYLAGMYWEASFAFGKVIALYPGFHKIDMAAFYMGKCYEYLQLNESARAIYEDALKKYTTSDMRPSYIYQLQNLDYKEGKYDAALKNYAYITNLYGTSNVKSDADYIAGQIFYNQGKFNQAREALAKIVPKDENYPYSQYTLAMSALKEKNMQAAIENLNNIVVLTLQTNSDKVLWEVACTKLGHIYYEQVKLRDAITYYNKVPATSRYADEALLASAWSYVKANKKETFNMAIQKADQLISGHPNSMLIPEAYLVKGYCYTEVGEFPTAKTMFEKCIELCKKPALTETQIKERSNEYSGFINQFSSKQKDIMSNALRKPDDKILATREELRGNFDQYKETQRQNLLFQEDVKQAQMFYRSKDKVLKDAEFALATVDNLSQTKKKEQIIKSYEKDQQEIDGEIEQMQKELESLEKK